MVRRALTRTPLPRELLNGFLLPSLSRRAPPVCSRPLRGNPTAAAALSCRPIRFSSRRYGTSSALICIRQTMPLVLCVDEKGQIRALNRSQPVLPIRLIT